MNHTEANLSEAYVLAWAGAGDESYSWASDELDSLVWQQPERAWTIILLIVERGAPREVLAILAAGPLENLLREHGPAFIARVEEQSRRDSRFREVLADVYPLACRSSEIRERIRHIVGSEPP